VGRGERVSSALLAGAAGADWGRESAVRLLVAHGSWTVRADFGRVLVPEGPGVCRVAWDRAVALAGSAPASSSELAVLRLACHLAGAVPQDPGEEAGAWSLRRILSPLGWANSALALEAVRFAAVGPVGGGLP